MVSLAVKIHGAHPKDLSPGYEHRLTALLALQGMQLESIYVRQGCLEMALDARMWPEDVPDAGATSKTSSRSVSRSLSSSTDGSKTAHLSCPGYSRAPRQTSQPKGASGGSSGGARSATASPQAGWSGIHHGAPPSAGTGSPGSRGSDGRCGRSRKSCASGGGGMRLCSSGGGQPSDPYGCGGGSSGSDDGPGWPPEHGGGGSGSGPLFDIGKLIQALQLPASDEALEPEGCFYDLSPPGAGPPHLGAVLGAARAGTHATEAGAGPEQGLGAGAPGAGEPGGMWVVGGGVGGGGGGGSGGGGGGGGPGAPPASGLTRRPELQDAAAGPSQPAWTPAPGSVAILDLRPRVIATTASNYSRPVGSRPPDGLGGSYNSAPRPPVGQAHLHPASEAGAAAAATSGSPSLREAAQLIVRLAATATAAVTPAASASAGTSLEVVVRSQGRFLPASTALSPTAIPAAAGLPGGTAGETSRTAGFTQVPGPQLLETIPAPALAATTASAAAAGGALQASGGAGSSGSAAVTVESFTCRVTLHALPPRPGLLLVEARRAGQVLGGAAVPVLLVDDPRVAQELQAAVDGWRGDPRSLEDVLMDLGCFLRHAPAVAVHAAVHPPAAVGNGQAAATAATAAATTAAAAVTGAVGTSPGPGPSLSYTRPPPDPTAVPVPVSELMRTRLVAMGLHLLSWFAAAPAAWPATLARLQSDMLGMGVSGEALELLVGRRPARTAAAGGEAEVEEDAGVGGRVGEHAGGGNWVGREVQLRPQAADVDDVQRYDTAVRVRQHAAPAPPPPLLPRLAPRITFPTGVRSMYPTTGLALLDAFLAEPRAAGLPSPGTPLMGTPSAAPSAARPTAQRVEALGTGSAAAAATGDGRPGAHTGQAAPSPPPPPPTRSSTGSMAVVPIEERIATWVGEPPRCISTATVAAASPAVRSMQSFGTRDMLPGDADAREAAAAGPGRGQGGGAVGDAATGEASCSRVRPVWSSVVSSRGQRRQPSEIGAPAAGAGVHGLGNRGGSVVAALREILWEVLSYPYDSEYGSYVVERSAQQAHLMHALISVAILLMLYRSWVSGSSCRTAQASCGGLRHGTAVLNASSIAPVLVAYLPYMLTGLGWLMFRRNTAAWLRVVALSMPLRCFCHTLACALIGYFGFAALPFINTYQLSGAVFFGDGALCTGTSMVHPVSAALHAVLEAPVLAQMWMVIGSPYSRTLTYLRAVLYSLTTLATNLLVHITLRSVYQRRARRRLKHE